jgi:acyl carrier protein
MTCRADLPTRFCGTGSAIGSGIGETRRNNLSFHKKSSVRHTFPRHSPGTGDPILLNAQKVTVENDGVEIYETRQSGPREEISRRSVMAEIWRHLEPYRTGEKPITGDTVITKDLTIDSLAVMDMVMELEDRFDISIPMNVVAEIYTVDELADTILDLSARR